MEIFLRTIALLVALDLVELHGPDGKQRIWLAPSQVTSIREPHAGIEAGHFAPGTRCLIFMTNKNFIAVHEHCVDVRTKLIASPAWQAP